MVQEIIDESNIGKTFFDSPTAWDSSGKNAPSCARGDFGFQCTNGFANQGFRQQTSLRSRE